MKWTQIFPLKAYLKQNPHIRLFLVLQDEDFERKKSLDEVLSLIPHSRVAMLTATQEISMQDILTHLESYSFDGEAIAILSTLEERKKKEIEQLQGFLEKTEKTGYFLIGARDKNSLTSLFDKKGCVLDFSSEKIWDKEKRLQKRIEEISQKENKAFPPELKEYFLHRVGSDLASLEQEMQKLMTYVGENKNITKEDIDAITTSSAQMTLWQLADKLVWENQFMPEHFKEEDATFFHGFIQTARMQLEQGLMMASLLEKDPKISLSHYFPKMFPKQLEKRKMIATQKGSKHFKKGLIYLSEMDLLSKSNVTSYSSLLEVFWTKFSH
jgi:hypothetical protein